MLNHFYHSILASQMYIGYVQMGLITSTNPTNYTVQVELQPDQTLTGFIPYCTPRYGWAAPPTPGQQCLVMYQNGNKNVPIGALLLYWQNAQPPGVVSAGDTVAGEFLLMHSSGSYFKLGNNGKVTLNGNVEIDLTAPVVKITTTGNIDLTASGNLNAIVTGNVDVTATGTATVQGATVTITGGTVTLGNGIATPGPLAMANALIAAYNSHVHSDPEGGNTGVPTVPLTTGINTTVVQGA